MARTSIWQPVQATKELLVAAPFNAQSDKVSGIASAVLSLSEACCDFPPHFRVTSLSILRDRLISVTINSIFKYGRVVQSCHEIGTQF